ncbi:MAG: glycosyltransferase [Flavobacterium sp.]|nr:glycosyltransferase [Flavobacterium sp.]
MKILYLTPSVNNEGGVAKSLSVKTNYFIENYNYSIHILTQNNGNSPLFHRFHPQIKMEDITLKGTIISRFFSYKNAINHKINEINPDVVVVSDNGLKGYLVPILLKKKLPIVFECHGSIFVEEKKNSHWVTLLKAKYKRFFAKYFTRFIVLSEESRKEWNTSNCEIIPNSIAVNPSKKAQLQATNCIVIARHSYEKGLDRLLLIWEEIQKSQPNWTLEIYGDFSQNDSILQLAERLELQTTVRFFEPIRNLEEKYLSASIMLMTSRTEGFPMAILEANSLGLPVIAYDCPIGPKSIIQNNETGFLIQNNNKTEFVKQLNLLMNDIDLRIKMGENAQIKMLHYNHQTIMEKWQKLFESLITH